MLLKEIKSIFHKELNGSYPKEEVDSFFYMLIEHHLGLERFVLALQPDLSITKKEEQPLFEALSQLRLHRPIQYIIGTAQFMDIDFSMDESVLIPRPETEELVRWILEEVRSPNKEKIGNNTLAILDIGTGSGCIAVALAKQLPDALVYGLDVSEKALETAQKNALYSKVSIKCVQGDILSLGSSGNKEFQEILDTEFDIIVSNPPYVREQEKKDMHKNVTEHEPGLALFVPDAHPLKFYDAIATFSGKNLKKNGILYLEINQYLTKETERLLKNHGFENLELREDMFGNVRMAKARKF